MLRLRGQMGRAARGALRFSLVVLGGCAGRGPAVNSVDAGVQPASPSACVDGGWCPALPTDFVGVPSLVGDRLIVRDWSHSSVRDPDGWRRVECPAESGADTAPVVLPGMTSETIVRCGVRLYRWGAAGLSPIALTGYFARQDLATVALPDVIFFATVDEQGQPFISRCSRTACESFELRSLGSVRVSQIFAATADDFGVILVEGGAFRHTSTGWSEVASESLTRPLSWPPSANATCLADGIWGACDSSPRSMGPFVLAQQTSSRALLRGPLGEWLTYDGTQTHALQSVSNAAFRRQYWPELDISPGSRIRWLATWSVDGVIDRSGERLFIDVVAAVPDEGTDGPRPAKARVFTRLGDGPWERLGDELGGCNQMSAAAVDNVWVACSDGQARHFDGRGWSTVDLRQVSRVCAMNDGSAIVLYESNSSTSVARIRVGEAPSQIRAADRLAECTHDDVFVIDRSGVIFHRAVDAWADVVAPPVPGAERELGGSDFGLTVNYSAMRQAFVWDGTQWQRRDDARASFGAQIVRFSSTEWSVQGAVPPSLMFRARR